MFRMLWQSAFHVHFSSLQERQRVSELEGKIDDRKNGNKQMKGMEKWPSGSVSIPLQRQLLPTFACRL